MHGHLADCIFDPRTRSFALIVSAGLVAVLIGGWVLPLWAAVAPSEVILELRAGRLARQTVLAFQADEVVLLPARSLLQLAEIEVNAARRERFEATLKPSGKRLVIEPKAGVAQCGARQLSPDSLQTHWDGYDLYVNAGALAALIGVQIQVDPGELTVTLSPVESLPIGRRHARERQRSRWRGRRGEPPAERLYESAASPWKGLVFDWTVAAIDLRDPHALGVQLEVGSELAGGALELASAGGSLAYRERPWTGSWRRAFPGTTWLRQVALGDVLSSGPRARPMRGALVTNAPHLRPQAFARTRLAGTMGPGWEVEVYRGGELVDFVLADERGYYELNTELDYGTNLVELRGYGPTGDSEWVERVIRVHPDRLPAGGVEYELSGGRCEGEDCGTIGHAALRYGVDDEWTATAGYDLVRRGRVAFHHPYVGLTGAVTQALIFRTEAVLDAFHAVEFQLEPSSNVRASIRQDFYGHGRLGAAFAPPGLVRQSRARLYWRPHPQHRSRFLDLHWNLEERFDRQRWTAAVGLTQTVGGVRWSTRYRQEVESRVPVPTVGRALEVLGARVVPRGPARGLLLRGECRYNLATKRLDAAALTAAKSVSRGARLELLAEWSAAGRGTRYQLALTTLLPATRGETRLTRDSGRTVSAARFEGSAVWNSAAHRLEGAPRRTSGRGGVTGVAFVDSNDNGWLDPGEQRVGGVRLRIGSVLVETDATGRYSAWDLGSFDMADLVVDTESIPNPLWTPGVPAARVVIHPNGFREVDLPLVPGHEVLGRVTLPPAAGGGTALVRSGVGVELYERATLRRFTTRSFGDGSFYFLSIPAGEYEIRIDPDQLSAWGLAMGEAPRYWIVDRRHGSPGELDICLIRAQR